MTPKEFIDYHKQCNCGLFLGKFLVPEFCKEIQFSIEDLKQLDNLIILLDDKHQYEKMIYDCYLENNDFILTKEQKDKIYNEYKKSRQK